ncbi:ABC transporter ATP-binding protein [Paenibacillus larvae]|uniref:ABC transporter, ATP-binding protein n=3 Tax=Paenibacillus larvae TaxID=1464 RepID=V9W5I0_9BACL|nr:ABC transporter ATP-binding protein [Paenibacillus larvae]AHD05418.1 ABC transporter, ATP-binding protein [Paenibacillus larvae subsp. larvae DSM 25430]AVF21976.1 ABC transporter, ATP-binding protein [Paenibacillus larvae subsp. larvae]AVF26183.1 ABC transporter, ATP-binding protein [Paenibacillus larvae subsp. larvae]AVF30960.1 ABC transporter, ATP-binding protein [Paenibacillus larvae subsp. larvae]AVG11971.1 ABC transporter, ATP-binding protein [Paenibacillus larvae subsp. larvae DSM 254
MTIKKLELVHLTKTFTQEKNERTVLKDISLHVNEGEFVSLIGPSGSGKSTLFHIIGGLIPPSSGEVKLEGKTVTGQKGLISYMPQQASLLPWRTIEQNVIMALEVSGKPASASLEKARAWLKRAGLSGYENSYPHVLSGGMQQRVSFLRALLSEQELMCLDEPFGALDALTRQDMQEWLLHLWEENKRSVLFVTHSIEEALYLSDRIYLLSKKPTIVLEEIRVPFDRPRREEVQLDSLFLQLKQDIYRQMKSQQAIGAGG